MRLSTILNPMDKILEVGERGFRTGIDTALKKNPEDAAVYDENPGLLDAIIDAGLPVMRKHLIATVPLRQRAYAAFYADKFSSEEIDQLSAFYSTPTGAKVVAAMYGGLDLGKLAEGMYKDGNLALTGKAVEEAAAATASHLPDKFDADDWKALFIFSAAPVHAKLVRVGPEFSQLAADLENEPDPAFDAEMDSAINGAVKAYLAKKKKSASPDKRQR
jgi:hypothetical protein